MTPILVFDLETVPDVAGLRRLHRLPDRLSDEAVVDMASQQRRAQSGSDFLPHYLQRIIAISCVLRASEDKLAIWSLGELGDDEPVLVRRFFELVERYTPQLVSWNGGGFDLPVLNYRALVHGIVAQRYWDWGDDDRDFRFNNYLARFHTRHIDLMDVLSLYQPRAAAPLDQLAQLCGYPGKLGMDGSQVWSAYRRGELAAIRAYCETDVANTYLLFLRFQAMRAVLDAQAHAAEVDFLRNRIAELPGQHWREFAAAMPAA
jgi:predicted PolB exonuclease-like 3'-5' exonuclease